MGKPSATTIRSGARADFARARPVDPRPITGRETSRELLDSAFAAFVGRQERDAYLLMRQSLADDHTVFATLSGAMTPAGIHQSCLIPMIERGFVSCLTTTGANLYHDAHRVIGHTLREVRPDADDIQLRLARIIRIYDLGFWEEVLLDTDRLFSAIVRGPEFQRRMTTPEFHFLLGRALDRIERAAGATRSSLLATCYRQAVPIFVGAVQDGSIFLNCVKLKKVLGEEFRFDIDLVQDVYAMAAMQHCARANWSRKCAVWIFGGGVPKNYTLQGEPLLDQVFFVPARGFDIDVQFCVDPVDNGALSSCPAGEGHTWGKVSAECVETGTVYCHTDVTAVLPWITHALVGDKGLKRKPRRLMDRFDEALALLDAAVARRRKELAATLEWDLGEATRATRRDETGRDR